MTNQWAVELLLRIEIPCNTVMSAPTLVETIEPDEVPSAPRPPSKQLSDTIVLTPTNRTGMPLATNAGDAESGSHLLPSYWVP